MLPRFLLTCILFLASVISSDALEITFLKSAVVDGSVVKMGDIVRFSEESELTRALSSQTVSQAPPPGDSISLRSLSIKKSVSGTKNLTSKVSWSGSPVVHVKRNSQTIGANRIQNLISEFLEEQKPHLPDAEINFTPHSLPLPFQIPVGDLTTEVIPSNPGILGSSRFAILFRIDGKVVKNMSVRGKLEAIAAVVVSAKSIKRGQILGGHHLTKALTDISKISDPGSDPQDFLGKRLKRSVRSGTPLRISYVETLPIVRKGEKVKIYIQAGSMLVTATGLAHSDGREHQIIRVLNINSRKTVFGRVTAPGLVEVVL